MSQGQGSVTYSQPAGSGSGGGGNLPGVTVPLVSFTIGDGQAGTPANGTTSLQVVTLQGQNLVNKQLLVIREGIELKYTSPGSIQDIKRWNSGGTGGFNFEGASGLTFFTGEHYDIYITGINNTIQV